MFKVWFLIIFFGVGSDGRGREIIQVRQQTEQECMSNMRVVNNQSAEIKAVCVSGVKE